MLYPSYYSMEELLIQRGWCVAHNMTTDGIDTEIRLVEQHQARQNHPSNAVRLFDQDA